MVLETRNTVKFLALDELRAVAALSVVVFHYSFFFGDVLPSAYLSVDLFFCISGVVIAHSYGNLLLNPSYFKSFIYLRILRLYPLFLLSVLMRGTIMLLSTAFGKEHLPDVLSQLLPALLFLPSPFHASLYPINGPAWSLFFEIGVNIVAAALWRNLSRFALGIIVIINAMVLAYLTLHAGTIDGGYKWSGAGLAVARVGYSFFMGVLIYKSRNYTFSIMGGQFCALIIFLILVSTPKNINNDLISVIFIFPILTYLALHSKAIASKLASSFGGISYPLYVLHLPILLTANSITVFLGYQITSKFGITMIVGTVIVCWLAERYYDRPIRRYLKRGYPRSAVHASTRV